MEKPSLIIKEISIGKMPGFPRGLETLSTLSPGINIVVGPNGSGKSSIARMIQQVIWPDQTDGIQLECSFLVETVGWERKIDFKSIILQKNGVNDELNQIPPSEERNRYSLALHDLVLEDDKNLARKILKESIGGYDLEHVQELLRYSDNIKSKAAPEFRDFDNAEKVYREILQKQKVLKKDVDKLDNLYQTKEKAQSAGDLYHFYELVINYLEAQFNSRQAEKEFDEFPPILAYTTGDEYVSVEELEKELENIERIIIISTKEKETNESIVSQINISEENIQEVLSELDQRVERINSLERSINDLAVKIRGCTQKVDSSLKAIDRNLESSEWEPLDLQKLSMLNEFFQTAHSLLSEKKFIETEIREVEKGLVLNLPKTSSLIDAIRSLSYWLQEQNNTSFGISKTWVFILAAVSIVAIIITYLFGWLGLFGIAVIVFLISYISKNRKGEKSNVRENDCIRTGLPQPAEWTQSAVIDKINQLNDELYNARLQEQHVQRIATLNSELDPISKRLSEYIGERDRWIGKLKEIPALPQEDLKHFSGLHWFLTHVIEWETGIAELESLKAENEELNEQRSNILGRINLLLTGYSIEKAVDAATASSLVRKLKAQEDLRKKASEEVTRQQKIILDNTEKKQAVSEKIKRLYEKLKIEPGQKDEIRQLLSQLEAYKATVENKTVAARLLSEKELLVKSHSLFTDKQGELTTLMLDQANSRAVQYKAESETFYETNNEIITIEANIKREKEGNDLELALRNKDERLEKLADLYKSNLSSITGKLIIEQLKKETREKNRPKVFKRANEIFNRITKGRYELRLEEKTLPSFIAYDTTAKIGQDLNALSTGTRIQLLISVRLAFIETQEAAIKLPILADELLANSDDIRAAAVIEALAEISKDGRQIFYFTAQADEVNKWKTYLDKDGTIPYEIKDISSMQGDTFIQLQDIELDPLKFSLNIAEPADNDHESYGKVLNVSVFDFISEELEQLHLWYLIDDNMLLHKCLVKGISVSGQLNSFLKNGGEIEGLDDAVHITMQKKIKFLSRFQELYRQGRSCPIDRGILESSGSVSPNYIDSVTAKLYQLQRNPQKLIESLRTGGVSGFRNNKTDELEQYLIEQGYISTMEVLTKEEILIQLTAFISILPFDPLEAEKSINRILFP